MRTLFYGCYMPQLPLCACCCLVPVHAGTSLSVTILSDNIFTLCSFGRVLLCSAVLGPQGQTCIRLLALSLLGSSTRSHRLLAHPLRRLLSRPHGIAACAAAVGIGFGDFSYRNDLGAGSLFETRKWVVE